MVLALDGKSFTENEREIDGEWVVNDGRLKRGVKLINLKIHLSI
jgi:hypothetical protein